MSIFPRISIQCEDTKSLDLIRHPAEAQEFANLPASIKQKNPFTEVPNFSETTMKGFLPILVANLWLAIRANIPSIIKLKVLSSNIDNKVWKDL